MQYPEAVKENGKRNPKNPSSVPNQPHFLCVVKPVWQQTVVYG